MKERPILFSGPMVRALLDGTKTQTRRVVKWRGLEPGINLQFTGLSVERSGSNWVLTSPTRTSHEYRSIPQPCPYGKLGDRLWVRETWSQPTTLDPGPTFYLADYPACVPAGFENVPAADGITWKPSIHMFRNDSRILLEVTDVRVERLQEISEADAIAEGIHPYAVYGGKVESWKGAETLECARVSPIDAYRDLWESINGADSWAANPFCWVIEFKVIKP